MKGEPLRPQPTLPRKRYRLHRRMMQRVLERLRPTMRGHRPHRLRAQRMPGGLSTPGAFSGEMVSFDMGPLALRPRRVHPAFMYKW